MLFEIYKTHGYEIFDFFFNAKTIIHFPNLVAKTNHHLFFTQLM